MRENKWIMLVSYTIALVTLIVVVLIQYSNEIGCCLVSYVIGEHGSFWENVCVGVFASALMAAFSSTIMYFSEKRKIEHKMRNQYFEIKESFIGTYEDLKKNLPILAEKIKTSWAESCLMLDEYKPLIRYKRYEKYRAVHEFIWKLDELRCEYTVDKNEDVFLKKVLEKVKEYEYLQELAPELNKMKKD